MIFKGVYRMKHTLILITLILMVSCDVVNYSLSQIVDKVELIIDITPLSGGLSKRYYANVSKAKLNKFFESCNWLYEFQTDKDVFVILANTAVFTPDRITSEGYNIKGKRYLLDWDHGCNPNQWQEFKDQFPLDVIEYSEIKIILKYSK